MQSTGRDCNDVYQVIRMSEEMTAKYVDVTRPNVFEAIHSHLEETGKRPTIAHLVTLFENPNTSRISVYREEFAEENPVLWLRPSLNEEQLKIVDKLCRRVSELEQLLESKEETAFYTAE